MKLGASLLASTVGGAMAAAALREELCTTILGFLGALSDEGQVRSLLLLVLLGTSTLESEARALPLELLSSHEALDPRSLVYSLPFLVVHLRRTTNLVTGSLACKLNSLRILEARFGPRRTGFSSSVSPGISCSPFFTSTRLRTESSWDTMH